jgi:hypothetical protein
MSPPVFYAKGSPYAGSSGNIFNVVYPAGVQVHDAVFILLEQYGSGATGSTSLACSLVAQVSRWSLLFRYCTDPSETLLVQVTAGDGLQGWVFVYRNCFLGTTPIINAAANSIFGPNSTVSSPAVSNNSVDGCLQFDLFANYSDSALGGSVPGSGFFWRVSAGSTNDIGPDQYDLSDSPFPVGPPWLPAGSVTTVISKGATAEAMAMSVVILGLPAS